MEMCIFQNTKSCNNCGECDVCELNKNKTCDNCGKCLQLEGYDVKAIKIDEVFEKQEDSQANVSINIEEFSDFDNDFEDDDSLEECADDYIEEEYVDALDEANNWQYIDDIDELKDLLEDSDSLKDLGLEKYPGLIVVNPNKII